LNDLLELKAEMVRQRIRQRQIARLLDIGESCLSDILNGIRPVDSEMKKRIRDAIDDLAGKK
jgi:hypothetical protein